MSNKVTCPDCDGDGYIEYDLERSQGFGRDVGYIDTVTDTCEMCQGIGEVIGEDEDEADYYTSRSSSLETSEERS